MKSLLFCIGLLSSLLYVGQSTAIRNKTAAGDMACPASCPIVERADVPGLQATLVADNQSVELPGWRRLNRIMHAYQGQRGAQWIYDGTRDESLYFENGHIA